MPRLIFINRSYWPEETATAQLLSDLAGTLAGRGWEVVVIASRPPAGAEREAGAATGAPPGVHREQIGSTRADRGGLAGKALDLTTFWWGALVRLARVLARGDTVVVLTDPPLLGVPVAWLARARGARCIHWVQDIYPEIAIAVTGRRSLRCLLPARNAGWRAAGACVALSREMAGVIARAGLPPERIRLIPNWAPAGLGPAAPAAIAALRREWGLADAFIVAYSGNLGRVHAVESVLQAAEALRSHPRIVFLFIGGGARRAPLERAAARRGLTRVHFRPHQSRARLGAVLGAADLHLVTMRPGCETYVFPSKLYGIAAVGRPVIFIGPAGCEAARTVATGGWGRAFDPADGPALARALADLSGDSAACGRLGAAALRFAAANGGLAAAADAWGELLAPGIAPPPASVPSSPIPPARPPA
jgi:glycosyltransferase involved in cell wall biosynthesis